MGRIRKAGTAFLVAFVGAFISAYAAGGADWRKALLAAVGTGVAAGYTVWQVPNDPPTAGNP